MRFSPLFHKEGKGRFFDGMKWTNAANFRSSTLATRGLTGGRIMRGAETLSKYSAESFLHRSSAIRAPFLLGAGL